MKNSTCAGVHKDGACVSETTRRMMCLGYIAVSNKIHGWRSAQSIIVEEFTCCRLKCHHNLQALLFHETPQRAAQSCFISLTKDLNLLFSFSCSTISQSLNLCGARSVVEPSGWATRRAD